MDNVLSISPVKVGKGNYDIGTAYMVVRVDWNDADAGYTMAYDVPEMYEIDPAEGMATPRASTRATCDCGSRTTSMPSGLASNSEPLPPLESCGTLIGPDYMSTAASRVNPSSTLPPSGEWMISGLPVGLNPPRAGDYL
ncbi:hypothetical protein E3T26_03920 [Cryobacterium sp. TMT1-21]|uniref:hypothetical protein n=1 Tax=Cryobacterium sp. TMT1-21 TaxID=1259234 RepID=UPI0010695964|nr:hypothetical protein [Cryobacterium sp. TMT1-21]TFD16599.1 hypothetical protein E3T26_03920 [Cryobacterium sp. TMT1-21]